MNTIIALGNPGAEYAITRHNFGWLAADRLEDRVTIAGRSNRQSYTQVTAKHRGTEFAICRPQTYMNLSGEAVRQTLKDRRIEVEDLLVIYDDLDIDFGRIKLAQSGGDGGHKGMRSIINTLGCNDFLRLRLGIGAEHRPRNAADYVLTPFTAAETEALDGLLDIAAEAALDLLHTDPRLVMNRVNRRTPGN